MRAEIPVNQLSGMRATALVVGHDRLAALCDRALGGDPEAMALLAEIRDGIRIAVERARTHHAHHAPEEPAP